MWRKKKWIIVAVVAAVVVLAAGVIGGVIYAESGSPSPTNTPRDTLMAKVAQKLGIDQSKLEDAFNQAQKEMSDEALNNRLKGLVQQGKITQDQADSYLKWWQSRPDVTPGLAGQPKLGPGGPMGFRGGFRCFPGSFGPPPNPTPSVTP
jgi:hypothetical protein